MSDNGQTRRMVELPAEHLSAGAVGMAIHPSTLLCFGLLLAAAGGVVFLLVGLQFESLTGIILGLLLGMGGVGLLVIGLYRTMRNLEVSVPGHFLLHPRTGTRFSPQQALSIQRRLDRIRREMSADSVTRGPELESFPPLPSSMPPPPLPSTPPPWTMDPPPSYDAVMKSQEQREGL